MTLEPYRRAIPIALRSELLDPVGIRSRVLRPMCQICPVHNTEPTTRLILEEHAWSSRTLQSGSILVYRRPAHLRISEIRIALSRSRAEPAVQRGSARQASTLQPRREVASASCRGDVLPLASTKNQLGCTCQETSGPETGSSRVPIACNGTTMCIEFEWELMW